MSVPGHKKSRIVETAETLHDTLNQVEAPSMKDDTTHQEAETERNLSLI